MAGSPNPEESIKAYRMRLDGVAFSTYILIMILVPLKVWCRKRAGGWSNVRWDDAFSVLALAIANGFFYTCIIGMRKQLGLHAAGIAPADIIDFLRNVFIAQMLYVWAISTIKFSVLAFYWRLFSVNARIAIYIGIFLSAGWLITLNFLVIFACLPVHASWDIKIPEDAKTCIALRSIYIGGSIPNVFTDLVLVLMPIPYVWRLNAPLPQRILLAGMFALGTFIAVVSAVRLAVFLRIPIATAGDVTYNFREIIVWSIVEINIGLTCACLPSLKPALAFLGLNSIFSSNGSRGASEREDVKFMSWRSKSGESKGSRPRKKGATGGLFSTLAGTKIDSEEDGFTMVDRREREEANKGNLEIELQSRVSGESRETRIEAMRRVDDEEEGGAGISVQRDWSVIVDERPHAR